jgi:hypothetical protein
MRSAEEAGFDQFWMFDSHVIWQDCYSVLGWLIGRSRSETMEFGTLVTNPVSRDPTVTASAFATLAGHTVSISASARAYWRASRSMSCVISSLVFGLITRMRIELLSVSTAACAGA